MIRWPFLPFLALSFFALSLVADTATPSSVANLVQRSDESALAAPLTEALRSTTPLVRATAARVIAIRGVSQLLPLVRETVAAETDATAAREELRALTLLGGEDDLAFAVKTSSQWPPMEISPRLSGWQAGRCDLQYDDQFQSELIAHAFGS